MVDRTHIDYPQKYRRITSKRKLNPENKLVSVTVNVPTWFEAQMERERGTKPLSVHLRERLLATA